MLFIRQMESPLLFFLTNVQFDSPLQYNISVLKFHRVYKISVYMYVYVLCTLLEHNSLSMVLSDDFVLVAAACIQVTEAAQYWRVVLSFYHICLRTTAPPMTVIFTQCKRSCYCCFSMDVLGFRYRQEYCFFCTQQSIHTAAIEYSTQKLSLIFYCYFRTIS